MIIKVKDNWFILTFESDDGNFACFGYNEDAVKAKFAKWFRAVSMRSKMSTEWTSLYD